jgi:hypothetical protein
LPLIPANALLLLVPNLEKQDKTGAKRFRVSPFVVVVVDSEGEDTEPITRK